MQRPYEDLLRPFTVSADTPYTDVWMFKMVNHYRGKHPFITDSSRVGAVVLDSFMGTGNTGVTCEKLGRKFIGVDKTEKYFRAAGRRVAAAHTGKF